MSSERETKGGPKNWKSNPSRNVPVSKTKTNASAGASGPKKRSLVTDDAAENSSRKRPSRQNTSSSLTTAAHKAANSSEDEVEEGEDTSEKSAEFTRVELKDVKKGDLIEDKNQDRYIALENGNDTKQTITAAYYTSFDGVASLRETRSVKGDHFKYYIPLPGRALESDKQPNVTMVFARDSPASQNPLGWVSCKKKYSVEPNDYGYILRSKNGIRFSTKSVETLKGEINSVAARETSDGERSRLDHYARDDTLRYHADNWNPDGKFPIDSYRPGRMESSEHPRKR